MRVAPKLATVATLVVPLTRNVMTVGFSMHNNGQRRCSELYEAWSKRAEGFEWCAREDLWDEQG